VSSLIKWQNSVDVLLQKKTIPSLRSTTVLLIRIILDLTHNICTTLERCPISLCLLHRYFLPSIADYMKFYTFHTFLYMFFSNKGKILTDYKIYLNWSPKSSLAKTAALHVSEPRRVAHPARQLAATILCLLRLLLLVATLISFSSHNRSIADGHNSKESGKPLSLCSTN